MAFMYIMVLWHNSSGGGEAEEKEKSAETI
jgi:hypothetical protein